MQETLCRFCGNKTAKKFSCIFEESTDENGPTLLEKINSCIPLAINEDDDFPKRLCELCLDETNKFYNFVQSILETQKTFTGSEAVKTEPAEDESSDGRRKTRASNKRTDNVPPECDPFECVTVAEPVRKGGYQGRTTELEIDLIPTETKVTGGKKLNEDVSNALKKLKSVSRNLTVSRTTAIKPDIPVVVPKALQRSRVRIESTTDHDNDEAESAGDYGDVDDSKSVSSFSSGSEQDSDEEEYMPRKKKQRLSSNTPKASTSSSSSKKDEKFTVYKINSPPVFLCLKCDTRFPTFAGLKAHINGDNECKRASLTCEICNKLCKNRKSLHGHVKGHEQKSSFVCDQCGKVYTNQFNLENHKSAQHGEYVQEHGHTYRCQMCEARFDNRTDLYAHIANHEKTPVTVVCDKCGKSFNSNKALHTHLRSHMDIRPFACTYCPKKFGKRLTLTQHLHVHTGIKTFQCDHCDKSFAKRDSLVAHKRKHTGETPYQCNYCSQKYSSLNQLKTHLKSHPVNDLEDGDEVDDEDYVP